MQVEKTEEFVAWMRALTDARAVARISLQIDRLIAGNPGHSAPVGEGISELKIDYGPGYRVYYLRRGSLLIILLCGGDKSSQSRDIGAARRLARQFKKEAP